MAKTKKSPHAAEVAALTQAKFMPQVQAIMMLLQQARGDRQQGIDVARSTGASVRGLAEKAQPQAQASLTQALTGISTARTQMPGVAPGVQGGIAAGSQRDMSLAESNANAQAQRTRDELLSRAQDAQTGAAQGVLQAQAQYGKTRQDLAQQLQNLSGQQGAFASAELARLLGEDTKRQQQIADREDGQSFTAGENSKYRNPAGSSGGKGALPGGVKRRTPLQEGTAKDSIDSALQYARQLKAGGRSMQEAGSTLKTGRESQTVEAGVEKNPATGKPRIKTVKVPGIPKQKTLWAQVAVQTAWWGGITSNTAKELHKRGYSYRALGLKIVKKPAPTRNAGAGAPVAGKLG